MSADQNVAALRRAPDLVNAGDLDGYIALYDDDVVLHGYPPGVEGKEGARAFYAGLFAALAEPRLELHDVVAEGDRVAARFTLSGTHQDELLGVPATGRHVDIEGQSFFRFSDGARIAERWQSMDALGLLMQLGAIPAPTT